MGRPAKSVVYSADATALGDLAEPTRTVGVKVGDAANTVHETISGLEWEGEGKDAAQGRADRELAQDRQVVGDYNALADAYQNGSAAMAPMISDLTKTGQGLESDSFSVSEDWVVTDMFDYRAGTMAMVAMGVPQAVATTRMNQLQAERGNEAQTDTVNLQQRADALGQADQDTATAISKAKGDLDISAPPLAGLAGGDQAINDLKDLNDGKASPEEKARVQAAMSSWTPDQLAALQQGKPATMPQGQYDYLKSLMRGMDGMSPADINKTMSANGLQGAMGDTLRMMTNPNVQTANGDHGGITNAPKRLAAVLNSDLTYRTGTGPGAGQLPMVPLTQLNAINDMLSHGNQDLRVGSDVDRGLLNESAKIAALNNQGHAVYSDVPRGTGGKGVPFDIASTSDINNTLTGMLHNASGDHQAVTDFLTGASDPNSAGAARMGEATYGHFDGNKAFLDLATHKFNDGQHPVSEMIGWMGPNAYAPGLEGWDAAASANATAHLLSNNHDLLAAGIPNGDGGYKGLGQVNPDLVQTATKNLIPFLGNLDGVHIPGIQGDAIPGFTDTKDLTNMIQVLDSDPASAEAINRGAAAWEQHFAYEFGQTGDSELGRHAGQLTEAVQHANQAELNAFKANDNWDGVNAYREHAKNWDTTKEILNDAAGYIPGGGPALSLAKDLANLTANVGKEDVLGIPGDPHKLSDSDWTKALSATDKNFGHLVDGHNREFNMTQGFLDSHPDARSQFQNVPTQDGRIVNFVDQNGQLDWNAVTSAQKEFNDRYDVLSFGNPSVHIGEVWDSTEHGYQSGLNDTTINSVNLPQPPAASQPPGQ